LRLIEHNDSLHFHDAAWDAVLDISTPDEAFSIAHTTYQRGLTDAAERAVRRAANTGHVESMYELGLLLSQRGALTEAERWLRQAIDAGHIKAMNDLGAVLIKIGRAVEGEHWIRRGAEAGDPDGMRNLGIHLVLRGNGDVTEAKRWLLAALEAGRADAAEPLRILIDIIDLWQAATLLRQAGFTAIPRLHTSAGSAIQYLVQNRTEHRAVLRRTYITGNSEQIICGHLLVAAGTRGIHKTDEQSRPAQPELLGSSCTFTDYLKLIGQHRTETIAHGLAAALIASQAASTMLPETIKQLDHALTHRAITVAPTQIFAKVGEHVERDGDIPFAQLVQQLPQPPDGLDKALSVLLNSALTNRIR
jgi:tetratricopeptide (TPR) repeat protein